MEAALVDWLWELAAGAFVYSVLPLVALDVFATAVLVATRDRRLVDRWTKPILVANAILLGTGVGVPLMALGARASVRMLAPAITMLVPTRASAGGVDEEP